MEPKNTMNIDFTGKNAVVGRTQEDLQKYKEEGTAYIGKMVMSSGENPVLGRKILMDVANPHLVLVCGKRGGGKCIDGETEIVLQDGSIRKIKDLEFDARNILSLNDQMKVKPASKTNFYKRKVSKMLEVKFNSGKTIRLTHEHPLLTIDGWKPVQELEIGGRIATPRKIETFGNAFLRECEVKLLAYLLTEGHTKKRAVWFTNTDHAINEDFISSVKEFDSKLETKLTKDHRTLRVVNLSYDYKTAVRNTLRKWLISVGAYDLLAKEKTIPDVVFQLPKTKIALLLNRMFSCDGSIYYESKRWRLSYSTVSTEMARQVHHLLLRFGILSRVRNKQTKYDGKYFESKELVIESGSVEKFIQEIGFFGKKEQREKEALEYFSKTIRNPNADTIPKEIWNSYTPKNWATIGRKMGYEHPEALRESQRYSPSRQKLLQIAKADQNEAIELLSSSDIFWDTIIEKREIEGDFEVFDLTVPEFHNFVANDIIVHNSYSMSVMIEEFARLNPEIKRRISVIVIDMAGIFWTLKVPAKDEGKKLIEWGLTPDSTPVNILVPKGKIEFYKEKEIPVDGVFTLRVGELDITEWMALFRFDWNNPEAILLGRVINKLKEQLGMRFGLEEVLTGIKQDEDTEKLTRQALKNRIEMAKNWGLLEKEGTKIKDVAQAGKITVIDVSAYRQAIGMEGTKDIIVALLGKKLFEERMLFRKEEEIRLMKGQGRESGMPIVWLMIDEAHMFMPKDEPNIALKVLLEWVRVGRQPGLSLVLATQRPNKLHPDAISQCDLFISHRMTAQEDIAAVSQLRPSYMHGSFDKLYGQMPKGKGFALLLDDNAENIYTIKIRPRFSWDGGVTASAFTK
jgi:intein/homing endonuclease